MFDPEAIEGGFARPVFDAQAAFRLVMDAMARPGTVQAVPPLPSPPAPLTPEAGAVALTLCDHDTPVWLDPALQAEKAVQRWLGFHTGAQMVATPAEAHFAFVSEPANLIGLDNFAQGKQDYPDRSTTLVFQVESLKGESSLVLEGPGIEKTSTFAPHPLPRHFAEQWAQNGARFPRGVDVVLVCPQGVAVMPRTTRIIRTES